MLQVLRACSVCTCQLSNNLNKTGFVKVVCISLACILWLDNTVFVNKPIPKEIDRLTSLCEQHISKIVAVKTYEYAPCYLWHDRPLYNNFGEQIDVLKGNTIYLHDDSASPVNDLFHELGHVIGRRHNMVGNRENGYHGSWENANPRLIAQVSQQLHWSSYLNLFSLNQENFTMNAASELWAELFMLWHLQPEMSEARLIDTSMASIEHTSECTAIADLANQVSLLRQESAR